MIQSFRERDRVHTGHCDVARIENETNILWVGVGHDEVDVVLVLKLAAEMGMNSKRHSFFCQAAGI